MGNSNEAPFTTKRRVTHPDQMPIDVRDGIKGVFVDIDDTLTSGGRLTAQAYQALQGLHDAGVLVIPVTGRPAGWCDHIARMWPVNAVVGENGAFYFRYDHNVRQMQRRYYDDQRERLANSERLQSLAATIIERVPSVRIAADQAYRESDLAIDYCEDIPRAEDSAVDEVVDIFHESGATAKVSSIHINGWFGEYDKLTMSKLLMRECFHCDLDAERERFVFVGDSPNDQPMFGYFPNSVGVANIDRYAARLEQWPRFVTCNECGAGFAELADWLLQRR